MILTALDIDPTQFEQRTGWSIKPQGACKGEQCVPLPANARNANGSLNGAVVAEALGMPLIKDEKHQLWALGPESLTGRALTTAQAPHLVLPDLEGKLFELASLRGKKVLLTTWASWCGCRTDGPIWAEVRERLYPKGLEIVTVAMDTAGADAVREWIELANPRHPALIDQAHIMGELFGVVNVPNGIWINEAGVIVRPAEPSWPGCTPVTEMELDDIEKWESVKQLTPAHVQILREVKKMRFETELYLQMLEDWAEHGANSQYVLSEQEVIDRSQPRPPAVAQAAARYELGQHLHLAGHHDDAIPHWREAHRLQPDNWTYKRQAWSFEDPTVQDPKGVYDGSMLGDLLEVGAINYYPKIIP